MTFQAAGEFSAASRIILDGLLSSACVVFKQQCLSSSSTLAQSFISHHRKQVHCWRGLDWIASLVNHMGDHVMHSQESREGRVALSQLLKGDRGIGRRQSQAALLGGDGQASIPVMNECVAA